MVKTNDQSTGGSRKMAHQSSQGSRNGVANKSTCRPKLGSNGPKGHYKGVRMRSWGSWVSEIRVPNQMTRIWLGSHSTPEAAARAYDAALLCLKGSSTSLNFPTSAQLLHLPGTPMSPKTIQRVAAAAAADATAALSSSLAASSHSTSKTSQTPEFRSTSSSQSSEASYDVDAATISGTEVEEELATGECMFDWSIYSDAFFQSPKCIMECMLNPFAFFVPPQVEECDPGEEVEISLWSFC